MILEAVADNQPIGLSELARRLDLPKSTVQRSLATLADLGWIRFDGKDSTRWTLGDRVRLLSERIDDLGRLRECAMPSLAQLNSDTLETIHLAVLDDDHVRLIERLESKHALRLVQPIGARSPLHASSTGKAILARLPEDEVDAYLERGLQRMTAHTLTDPRSLRDDLDATRSRGYAIADEELIEGIVSVGACVQSEAGRPMGSISISGPSSRMTPEVHAYGKLVAAAANDVAARLRA